MKIICEDNFNRDYISDWLVAENVSSIMGKRIVKLLNEYEGKDSPNFYKLVKDDYKLYKFEP